MVVCFIANGFEEIEALTPVDCLRRCELDVLTVGIGSCIVRGSHGIAVVTDTDDGMFEPGEAIDMVILPGGMPGTLNLEANKCVQKTLDYCIEHDIPIAAICAAPSILGHKGLLEGKKAVCYPGFESELKGAQIPDCKVVTDGNVITAKGMGAALEFSYAIIEKLISKERADLLKAAVVD